MRSLTALMAFTIFTLSLACMMPFCMDAAHAAQMEQLVQDSPAPPCHGDEPSEQEQGQGPMLSSDCLGVDLFHSNSDIDLVLDHTINHIDFAWTNLTFQSVLQPENLRTIRGPPLDYSPRLNEVPLYLTTQRLRI